MTTLHLPRTLLQPSATNRKHFDAAKLAELHESIKAHNVLQALIIRAIAGRDGSDGQPQYEIVSGERRWRASEGTPAADALPCDLRELTDVEALQIQLIENVQREDLHPLEEAQGYGNLQQAGQSIDQIADAVGKSKPHVRARLRLQGLTTDARAAFFAGRFGIASALQIARLNTMHQAELVQQLEHDAARDAPWSADTIAHQIRTRYTLRLAGAIFSLHDAELVPAAGACSTCPKRSGANPELFDDITEADTCTDRTCFANKSAAHVSAAIVRAEARGGKVIDGKEAERLLPVVDGTVKGFLRLDRPSEFALSKKPLRELVPADDREATLIVRDMGDGVPHALVEVMPTPYVRKLLADKGLLAPDADDQAAPSPTKPKSTKTKRGTAPTVEQAANTVAINAIVNEFAPAPGAAAERSPELEAALAKLDVIPAYRLKGKSPITPPEKKRWLDDAVQNATDIMAAAAIGESMRNDGAFGFPSEGLSHIVARSLIDTGQYGVNDELLAQFAGLPADCVRRGNPKLKHWLWDLSDDEAARLAIVVLALQERPYSDAEPQPSAVVAEVLGVDHAAIASQARAYAQARMEADLAKVAKKAAAKPKASAKPTTKAKRPGGNAKPPAKKLPPVKYRDAATGQTWSGKGLQPKWLKVALASGKKLSDFDVSMPGQAAPGLKPVGGWPFPTGDKPKGSSDKLDVTQLARAREHVIATRRASISSVQRELQIGYNAAARLLEQLELDKVIGPMLPTGQREVLVTAEGASA